MVVTFAFSSFHRVNNIRVVAAAAAVAAAAVGGLLLLLLLLCLVRLFLIGCVVVCVQYVHSSAQRHATPISMARRATSV